MENKFMTVSIPGYDNYVVDMDGKVTNTVTGRTMAHRLNSCGYAQVHLSKNGKSKNFYVHRLVCCLFGNSDYDQFEINHIDGNKLNNNIDNLELTTRLENYKHAVDNKLIQFDEKGLFKKV